MTQSQAMELFPLGWLFLAEHQEEAFGSNQGAAVFVVRFSVKNPSLGAELALGRAGESQLFIQFG